MLSSALQGIFLISAGAGEFSCKHFSLQLFTNIQEHLYIFKNFLNIWFPSPSEASSWKES